MDHAAVYIDNSIVDWFAACKIDPVEQLANSEFFVATIPDLAREYTQALAQARVRPDAKLLLQRLLDHSREVGIFGFAESHSGGSPFSGFGHGSFAAPSVAATVDSIAIRTRAGKAIPKNRTDAFLIALSEGAIVITNDRRSPWKGRNLSGVVLRSDVEAATVRGETLLDLLRKRFLKPTN